MYAMWLVAVTVSASQYSLTDVKGDHGNVDLRVNLPNFDAHIDKDEKTLTRGTVFRLFLIQAPLGLLYIFSLT